MGNYFCYDYPACLELEIETEFDVSNAEYGYLYSVYAIPNLILPLFGGILFDKYGNRVCLLCFTSILMLGQGLFTFGGYQMNYAVMLLGRAVFGIGSESMYVGQASIISDWFMNYEMPLAMAMTSCIPLCGSFIGGSIIPRVYYHNSEDLDVS
jgi:MFS family permease